MLRKDPRTTVSCFALLVLVGLGSQSCRNTYEDRLQKTGKPALHAVHSDRLQQVMRQLGNLTFSRLPQEIDVSAERQRRVKEVSQTALAMAGSADAITQALQGKELSAEHRREFEGLAQQLGKQAKALEQQAAQLTPEQMQERLSAIKKTCTQCHDRFRVSPPLK